MLNAVKHLYASTLCLQILRFAEDDKTEGKQKEGFRTVRGLNETNNITKKNNIYEDIIP